MQCELKHQSAKMREHERNVALLYFAENYYQSRIELRAAGIRPKWIAELLVLQVSQRYLVNFHVEQVPFLSVHFLRAP